MFAPSQADLIGINGNAYSILGTVSKGLKRAGNSKELIDQFMAEAMSGDYDNLLQTAMKYTSAEAGGFAEELAAS